MILNYAYAFGTQIRLHLETTYMALPKGETKQYMLLYI